MTMQSGLAAIRDKGEDPKRARILEGALKVFLAYGYGRTTMDDIARSAELSRPALYLIFRNKADIFRAIARCIMARCTDQSAIVLDGRGTLVERLDRMIDEVMARMLREILESPHGIDLLDMKNSLAADVMSEWYDRMEAVLERAFAREVAESGADVEARGVSLKAVADTFLDAMEGIKVRFPDPADHPTQAKLIIRVIAAALRP